MSGSRKWFVYYDARSFQWAVNADESTVEALYQALANNENEVDLTPASFAVTTVQYHLPPNVEPRYARFATQDNSYSVKIVLHRAQDEQLVSQVFNVGNVPLQLRNPRYIPGATDPKYGSEFLTLYLRGVFGEQYTPVPSAYDTGLDDGDNT